MEALAEKERSNGNAYLGAIAAGALIGGVLLLTAKRARRYSFRDRVVLITGGSRGLGLILARKLLAEGASVCICARDKEELERAEAELSELGRVYSMVCDVRRKEDCEIAVGAAVERFGRLDVLINVAGVIQAGPLEAQTDDDFRDAVDTHMWGPYYTMTAAIPHLKAAGDARIINIASIGGKVAVPHLAPYCTSKFGLVGLSNAFGAELAKDGITVTTVNPGLMRIGSHVNAQFKGQNELEYALFSMMDATPLTSMNAERAAEKVLEASRRGDADVILSVQAKAAHLFNVLFPNATRALFGATARLLPGADGPTDKITGLESQSELAPNILTSAVDAAAYENNELKPGEEIGRKEI
jgi:NAD(P)-dependent dehydrogenase (short-subunit alcohol dehydrogenase family)